MENGKNLNERVSKRTKGHDLNHEPAESQVKERELNGDKREKVKSKMENGEARTLKV